MKLTDILILILIIVTTIGFGIIFIMVLKNALAQKKPGSLTKKN